MSFFSFLRRKPPAAPGGRSTAAAGNGKAPQPAGQLRARNETVRLALRDTLARYGIASSCIDLELAWQPRAAASRSHSLHLQLLIRQLEPQLLTQGLSFQRSLLKRVRQLDPRASAWIGGVSWQFAVPETADSQPPMTPVTPTPAATSATQPAPAPEPTVHDQVEELRRLFAIADAQRALAASTRPREVFEPTRPSELR